MLFIMQLNVNGIKGKFKRLNELARDYDVSVVVVSELKTSNFYTFDRAELDQLYGYTLYLESARCAVYVKNDLKNTQNSTSSASTNRQKTPGSPRSSSTVARCRSPTGKTPKKDCSLCRVTARPAQQAVTRQKCSKRLHKSPAISNTQSSPGILTSTTSVSAPKRRTWRARRSWIFWTRRPFTHLTTARQRAASQCWT